MWKNHLRKMGYQETFVSIPVRVNGEDSYSRVPGGSYDLILIGREFFKEIF